MFAAAVVRGVVRRLGSSADPPPDAELVAAFAAGRDPDAFAALVDRHGPTVLGVCRRVLGDSHDAEDAFQATFLVLALKANSVRPPGSVGGWLYGVAVRTANKAKVAAARRRRREMIAASAQESRERERPESSVDNTELQSVLDAELAKLPEALRAAVVLCDLHGKTRSEAAAELGCPEGTVAARLHRARKKLADALSRRGLALPAAGLAAVLAPVAVSAAATRSALGAALGSASPVVLALAREVTRSMSTNFFAVGVLTLVAGGLLAAGTLLNSGVDPSGSPAPPTEAKAEQPAEAKTAPAATSWKEAKVLDHTGWLVGSVAYSADGKTLFVGGTSGHVRAYTADTFTQIWEYKGGERLAAVTLAPDGKTLAVTTRDGVQFLDAATGKAGDFLEEKGSEPLAVGWFPDSAVIGTDGNPIATSRKVIFGSARGYFVKTWLAWPKVSTIATSTVAPGKQPADEYAAPLAVSPDGKRVVTTGPIDRETGTNVLWAWAAGSDAGNQRLDGHKAAVTSAAWSADGKVIVTGDVNGLVITWDAETFKEKSRLLLGDRIAAVAVADGNRIADFESQEPLGKVVRRQPESIIEINLGSDANVRPGDTFIVLPGDFPEKGRQSRIRKVRVPDERGGYKDVERFVEKAVIEVVEVVGPNMSRCRITREADPIRDGAAIGDLLYKPVGGRGSAYYVAASSVRLVGGPGQGAYAEEVFVWQAANPPEKPEPISSHQAGAPFQGVASLAFSPDGKSLASGFCNFTHLARTGELVGKVRVWKLAEPPAKPEKPVGSVIGVEFSPDGKRYCVLKIGTAEVYDSATGQQVYSADAEGARFTADGKSLVAMGPKQVAFHNAENGQVTTSHNRPKTKWGWHQVAFSPDGKRYAAYFGSHARLYDTTTGFEPAQLDELHEMASFLFGVPGQELVFSPDGKRVAAVGVQLTKDGSMGAAVWDTETGKRLHAFAPALDDAPQAVAFSADGKSIAVGYNKKIEVWTGGKMQPKNLGDQGLVTALAFTPDGTQLAAGIRLPIFHGGEKPPRVTGHKSEVRLIDLATDKVVKVFDGFEGVNHLAATKLPVSAIAFSRDGKKLLAGTGYRPGKSLPAVPKEPIRGEVKLWDIAAPDPAPAAQKWQDAAILTDHGTLVDSVAFAPDGKTFAVGGPGGDAANTVTVWDTATRKQVWKGGVFPAGVTAVAYNPDGTLLAATRDKVTGFFNPKNGESVLMNPPFPGGRALAFSPDGGRIAVSDGKKTTVRDTGQKGGKNEFKSVIDATDGPFPAAVAWSKDGKYLAVPYHEPISGEYAVDVYDVAAEKAKPLAGHPGRVTAVAWSKDGKLIVSGDQKGTVIAWDADARKELWRKAFKGRDDTIGRVNAIAISPADNTVAVAVSMGSGKGPERVVLLAPADGKDVDHLMRPWSVPVSSVAWSKDGTLLITGCGSAGRPVNQDESAVGEVVIWERKP